MLYTAGYSRSQQVSTTMFEVWGSMMMKGSPVHILHFLLLP